MHRCFYAILLAAILHLSLVVSDESDNVVDSFKVFENFPFAVALMDTNNDSIFECLTAKRAWFDKDAKQGEYIWQLRGHKGKPKKAVAFYVAEGQSPDTFLYMEGEDDNTPEVARFYYSDYKNCAVLDMPYSGRQCVLWTSEEHKDSPPEECVHQYKEHCGGGIPLYTKDICKDSEVANW